MLSSSTTVELGSHCQMLQGSADLNEPLLFMWNLSDWYHEFVMVYRKILKNMNYHKNYFIFNLQLALAHQLEDFTGYTADLK